MKLREYMDTHPGDYSLAESTTAITVDELDLSVGELEVEEYMVGLHHAGREKLHIYSVAPIVHIVTRLTLKSEEVSERWLEAPSSQRVPMQSLASV